MPSSPRHRQYPRLAYEHKLTGLDCRRLLEADARARAHADHGQRALLFLALIACLATIVALLGILQ